MTYTIKLPQFEGPFDLLLFFIERDELDIYDIPVAKITKNFLEYIRDLERLNINVAGEFILVAASLMRIKAKLLLPRKELDEEGNEVDPRQELVNRLIEYKRFKDLIQELKKMEAHRQKKQHRGNLMVELQVVANQALADAELENLNLFRLLKAYKTAIQNFREREERHVHTVVHYNYTLEERRQYLVDQLSQQKTATFTEIFGSCENRMHAIFTFLALLELLQQEKIKIVIQSDLHNDFVLLQTEKTLQTEESEEDSTQSDEIN